MEFTYKKATLDDLDLLTETRITVLRAANGLSDDTDMSEVEEQSRRYYREALADGSHAAYLVFDGDRFIGAGGVSFFRVMPTFCNPTGEKAYIMNMYTAPEYRRKGIARHTLDLLVNEAKSRGVHSISLEATDAGRPLYKSFGFVPMNNEMELPAHISLPGLPQESCPEADSDSSRHITHAVARVTEMENAFDSILELWKNNPENFGKNPFAMIYLEKLMDYYEGGQWMDDFRMDEQGMFPSGLKRGILSEDGFYNFLEEIREVRWDCGINDSISSSDK